MAVSDYAMMIDSSICVNCEACTTVCKQIYSTSNGIFRTKMHVHENGTYPAVDTVFNKKACMHCADAQCVMSCPTGACHKTDEGLTVIDDRTCILCNYCAANCPYGAISFDRSKSIMDKCSLCNTRVEKGLSPLCAEVCTPKAITYGPRTELIAGGEQRVSMLKGQGYEGANLYGITEFDGLGVLLVLQHEPAKYNLPAETEAPMGKRVFKYLLSPFGGIAALAAIGALIYNFASNRKNSA